MIGEREKRWQMRVLLVEDNKELVALVAKALERAGLDVDSARSVDDADLSVKAMHYAVVVLDLGLPDADGLLLLDRMRRRGDQTPVLILSARDALGDRVSGLHKGASDYLVKPFAMDELVARIQALLRRAPRVEGRTLTMGNVSLDTDSRQAVVESKIISIPAREAEVLEVLLRRGSQVIPHDVLQGQIFGATHGGSSNATEVYVHRLRRVLAEAGANVKIHTIRGAGYLMTVEKEDSKSGA